MQRMKFSVTGIGIRFLVAIAWLATGLMFILGTQAQQAPPPGHSSANPLLITNLQQLSKLLESSPRVMADLRLDVLVCSASRSEIGVVAVMDQTGGEMLELGPQQVLAMAGDIIRIEGQHCLLRKRESGIEISRAPTIDNDGTHALRRVAAEVSLSAGLHPFKLDYFNVFGTNGLALSCRLPDGTVQSASRFCFRTDESVAGKSNLIAGLNVDLYEGGWLNVPDFAVLQPFKRVAATNLDTNFGPQKELLGIRFRGFFSAPMDGNYLFNLESDDGSLAFLNAPEVPWTKIGQERVPSPSISSLHTPMNDSEALKWMSLEGRVVFASRSGRGFRFELRSRPDSIWVTVADGRELDPVSLLNCRIRVTGMGRSVITPNRDWILGELSVATFDSINILEDPARGISDSQSVGTLVAVGQIQSLSKQEAARGLPVRIQGIVTSVAPSIFHFMSVQDETRGVFVRLSPSIGSGVVAGQFCEVAGHTDAGDFAPIVVAEHVVILGKGQMPPAAHPTWNELINGSMDVQWVELQGIVTTVQRNSFTLLLPEGEIRIEAEAWTEPKLKSYERAFVRMRGVLFAAWNTNRTIQIGHFLMRNTVVEVVAPAPRDPFDVPLKSWSELYTFDLPCHAISTGESAWNSNLR